MPGDARDERGDVLSLAALDDVGGHRAVAETRGARADDPYLQTAVGERVQDDRLRGLQGVESRSPALPNCLVGGERATDRAMLAEELGARRRLSRS